MGINAQTSVPKFTIGDVLTAANTNLLTNAPPVFSGTATRDAAFGGAGEKTLAEGQLCYLEDSDIVQYYSGSAWESVGVSKVVQVKNNQIGTVATGTTVMPFDNTIPQNTEGTEFLTLAITPTSASNLLIVSVVLNFSYSIVNTVSFALFQDSTANALAASAEYGSTATGMINSGLVHKMTAGPTSATTFKVRLGGESAGTVTLNGYSGGQIFGGVMTSSMTITEYTV